MPKGAAKGAAVDNAKNGIKGCAQKHNEMQGNYP